MLAEFLEHCDDEKDDEKAKQIILENFIKE
jgi:hypothetical protein